MSRSLFGLPFLVSVLAVSFFAACDHSDGSGDFAGTATDTENTIAAVSGEVLRTDGEVSAFAKVRMARVAKKADSVSVPEFLEVYTDTAGSFSFDSVLADTFQLAVIDSDANEIYYLPRATQKSKDLEKIKLSKAAVFSSKLYYEEVSDSAVAVGSHFTVFMPGTPFSQSVFAGDSFSMLIPEGTWWFTFCPFDPEIIAKLADSGIEDTLVFRSWSMDSISIDAGDTLDVGPFLWSVDSTKSIDTLMKVDTSEKVEEDLSRISGKVLCKNKKNCKNVEVQVVTDLFGFGLADSDSLEFKVETVTDSLGRWYLPLPSEVPFDSFRVEYRRLSNDSVIEVGLSKYVKAKELKDLKDTFDVGETQLRNPSKIRSSVRVVVQDTIELDKSVVNSVVMGIMGTTHFVRELTWNDISMTDLPDDEQELVLYTGDQKVLTTLKDSETSLDKFITRVNINLPEGKTLEQQGMTYNPSVYK